MKSENEIVLIRISSLGDVAMLIPVLISFHNSFPKLRIKLISRERFRPIFKPLDFVDFVGIDKNRNSLNFINLIRFFIDFNPKNNLEILDCHDVLRTKILSFLFQIKGNKKDKIDKGRAEKKQLIEFKSKELSQLKTSHQRYQSVFKNAGYDFELLVNAFLPKIHHSGKSEKWIGIAPFAKHSSKQFALNKWQEIISKIKSENSEVKFFIFGAGNIELEYAKLAFENIENIEFIINERSFEDELNLISKLDLMISMDSGNGHLAANYGVPVITIWGSTHPCLGFAPYGQPIENSIFPNSKKYPFLPVSIFGKNVVKDYEQAIDSIDLNQLTSRVYQIINL